MQILSACMAGRRQHGVPAVRAAAGARAARCPRTATRPISFCAGGIGIDRPARIVMR